MLHLSLLLALFATCTQTGRTRRGKDRPLSRRIAAPLLSQFGLATSWALCVLPPPGVVRGGYHSPAVLRESDSNR